MVLRVQQTATRLPTNSLYTPMDNTPLHSISSVCHPCGGVAINSFKPALHVTAATDGHQDVVGIGEVRYVNVGSNLNPWVIL